MNTTQPVLRSFLPPYVSWLTIVLALLAIGTFIFISNPGVQYATRMGYSEGGGVVPPTAVGVPMMDGSARSDSVQGSVGSGMYYPYPYPNPEVPITDMREFLKIYYNASMRTRDVPGLTRRVETVVRGYDGRIDQESSSEKYGYVSFAISEKKYDAFRTELEGLVDSRFLTVNISSQNLLSQKVSIGEQQKQADTSLADYQSARQKLVNAHALSVQALQAKIDAPETSASDRTLFNQQLASENATYAKRLASADANIKYAQEWQKAVQTQDQTLLNTVATVTGTVSIQWIGLWDIAQLYLPGYWIPAIFAALAFLSYLRDRRRLLVSAS